MNVKQMMKNQKMQAKQQEMVMKAGPVNQQWRQMFLRLWQEYKSAQLRKQTAEAQINALNNQMRAFKKDEPGYKFKVIAVQDNINSMVITLELEDVQIMVSRDQLIQQLGKEWTIKKAWDVIKDLEKKKAELFELSERG